MVVGSGAAQPFDFSIFRIGSPSVDPITTAASLRLAHLLNHRFSLHLHIHSYFKDIWCSRDLRGTRLNLCHLSKDAFSSTWSACLCFFDGGDNAQGFKNMGMSNWNVSATNPPNTRKWTNILLAVNVIVFMAQLATQGKLLLWGAKINYLINKGQLWRLATSSFLHANIGHLMVNCYSLNSVGPAMEKIGGARRFLAVYFASAVASSATSYWFCNAPAVGASGAIFGLRASVCAYLQTGALSTSSLRLMLGLVGSFAVFILRHRSMFGGGNRELQQIVHIIGLNMTATGHLFFMAQKYLGYEQMAIIIIFALKIIIKLLLRPHQVIGLMSKGIDNWGHIGGLVGGAATAWLLGPAWKYEYSSRDGRRIFSDKAPIFYLITKSTGS